MAGKPTYTVLFVSAGGYVTEKRHRGAPEDGWLCSVGSSVGASFAIRLMPSCKGWRITDIRKAVRCASAAAPSRRFWAGYVRGKRIFPSSDAALMYLLHVVLQKSVA